MQNSKGMVKQTVILWFLFLNCLLVASADAQVILSNDLDTARVYHDLNRALRSKEEVLRLDLSRLKLDTFPQEIFQLTNLQELKLNKCRITELPDRFDALPYLQRVQFQHNEITVIPPTILQLNNLKMLDLADNIIEVIPNEIDDLSHLETLALWDNPITTYPETLMNLQRLKVLDLLNNAISKETQQRMKEGLPECKIIMSPPCACMDGDN